MIVSACLASIAAQSGELAFLAWLALLPLFYAIRTCSPARTMLCGALWGSSFAAVTVTGNDLASSPPAWSLALLATAPALYAYLGARLTRWMGFSPFVLGFAWMLVELALAPLGLRTGLLAAPQNDGTVLAWVGQGLGYVFVAFLVALASASLVSALSGVQLTFPQCGYRVSSPDCGVSLTPQAFFYYPLFALCPSQPRAPPNLGVSHVPHRQLR